MKREAIARLRGFGLTDLMVGLSIGMVATLVILNVAVLFDARRRAAAGSADAQAAAAQAVAMLSRELRNAGNGLGPPDALGCIVHWAVGSTHGSFLLAPAIIVKGLNGLPDTLLLLSSGEQAMPPARLVAPYSTGTNLLTLDSTLGLASGMLLMLQSTGQPDCALLRLSTVSIGGFTVQVAANGNPLPGKVFGNDSAAVNLGSLRYLRYSVDEQQRLQMERFDTQTGLWIASPIAHGIVNLQLQYGFDDRAGVQAMPEVTRWSDTVVDADGDNTVGDSGDWQRLLALRVVVVTRSARQKDQGCDSTAPEWVTPATGAAGPVRIPIRVDHLVDWNCWRYRLLQTEVPLRNQLWRGG